MQFIKISIVDNVRLSGEIYRLLNMSHYKKSSYDAEIIEVKI